jgi:TetR/AcrR family transcriptional regulator, cholesterol catabolism regulator
MKLAMNDTPSLARERVLNMAEKLFSDRGYNTVTLRDIAAALGMKQSSLYNHAPGGKEELYIAVMERGLERHRTNLSRVIGEAEPHLRAQLRAVARWLLSQPPIDLVRMTRSDMPSITPAHAQHLTDLAGKALFEPIILVLDEAYRRGELRHIAPGLFTSSFLTLMDALHDAEKYSNVPKHVSADDVIDMLLDGVLRR